MILIRFQKPYFRLDMLNLHSVFILESHWKFLKLFNKMISSKETFTPQFIIFFLKNKLSHGCCFSLQGD